jgi:ADP-heptose:LPS heptosyltransferase
MAFFLRKLKKQPRKLLISRTDRIGDFILTLPLFKVIAKELKFKFSVLCQESVTPLLLNNPYVKETITVSRHKSQEELVAEIRSQGFDTLLVLVNDRFTLKLLPQLHFIHARIGPISKPTAIFHYTHPVIQKRSHSRYNEAEYNLELLKIFGPTNYQAEKPELYFDPFELATFQKQIKQSQTTFPKTGKMIVLHAGMQGSALNWKRECYQQLLILLLTAGHYVILTGTGENEREQNQNFIHSLPEKLLKRITDLSCSLTLRELSLLIKTANLFIGPSTGPTHIANAVGTPLISFYPKIVVQAKKRWEPFLANSCIFTPPPPCGQKFRCIRERCLHFYCFDQIKPEQVFYQAELFLAEDGEKKE